MAPNTFKNAGSSSRLRSATAGATATTAKPTKQGSISPASSSASDRAVTAAELEAHNGKDGTYWLSIRGVVYDMTDFYTSGSHPGGHILRTAAGRDATCLYESYHPFVSQTRVNATLRTKCPRVGTFADQEPLGNDAFWQAVSSRAHHALKAADRSHHSTPAAVFEAVFTVVAFYALHIYIGYTASFAAAAMLGLITGRMGFLMHAGVHCGFSSNPTVNYYMGLAMDMAGGSNTIWSYEHNVAHHGYTQEPGKDNDATIGNPFMRLHPSVPLKWYHGYQHIYTFIGICFGFFKWWASDMGSVVKGEVGSTRFHAGKREVVTCFFFKFLKMGLAFGLPCYFHGPGTAAALMFTSWALGAQYLENIFIVNHIQDETYPDPSRHWAEKQLQGTWNWRSGSPLANWISGGLNHQIEHHLFPAVAPGAYPTIAPVVKATCEEFGIAYNSFDTFGAAWMAMFNNLRDLGSGSHIDMVQKST